MKREDVAVPPSTCPSCGYRMDSATSIEHPEIRPKEGDLSVCIKCGTTLKFGKGLRLRAATRADIDELPPETAFELGRTTAAILAEIERRRQS